MDCETLDVKRRWWYVCAQVLHPDRVWRVYKIVTRDVFFWVVLEYCYKASPYPIDHFDRGSTLGLLPKVQPLTLISRSRSTFVPISLAPLSFWDSTADVILLGKPRFLRGKTNAIDLVVRIQVGTKPEEC